MWEIHLIQRNPLKKTAAMGWFKKYQRLVEVDEDEEEKEQARADEQASSFDLEMTFSPTNCWLV